MGDLSAEPSMEDILSSIKRIIAEEGESASGPRPIRRPRSAARPIDPVDDDEEVLELSDPLAAPSPADRLPVERMPAERMEEPASREETRLPPSDAARRQSTAQPAPEPIRWDAPDPIVSRATAEASRGALDALARTVAKPEPPVPGPETLEGLVRDMLRPMLREWLDANLSGIVQQAVEREVARISGRQG